MGDDVKVLEIYFHRYPPLTGTKVLGCFPTIAQTRKPHEFYSYDRDLLWQILGEGRVPGSGGSLPVDEDVTSASRSCPAPSGKRVSTPIPTAISRLLTRP